MCAVCPAWNVHRTIGGMQVTVTANAPVLGMRPGERARFELTAYLRAVADGGRITIDPENSGDGLLSGVEVASWPGSDGDAPPPAHRDPVDNTVDSERADRSNRRRRG